MTKTNLVYGMMGVIAGIILGVLIGNATVGPQQNAIASAPTQVAAPLNTAQQQQQQLPEGHPPVDNTVMQTELAQHQAVLMKDPQNQQSLVAAANISYDMKNYVQAIPYYEQALKHDPQNLNLITDLGTSYYYSNQPQKALEMYGRSLSIDPKHLQSLMNMGVVKMSVGDHTGAAEAWETALKFHPDIPEAAQMKDTIQKLRSAGK